MLSPIHPTRYSTLSGISRQARLACLAWAVLCLASVATPIVLAQGNTSGAFSGIVRDKGTGKPVPGAKVVLRNQDFDTQSTVITQEDGKFSKGSLPTGSYEIEISANGYVTAKRVQTLYSMASYPVEPTPFDLQAETVAAGPTPVAPTGPPPVVTSTPAASTGQSAGPETSAIDLNPRHVGIFDRGLVVGLPLGGTTLTRTFDELAFLVPGVNPPPQAIGNSVGPGIGGGVGTSGQFSVNGLRSRANNFTVDGSDNNDEDIGVRRQGFFSLVPQPIESIQEFQIVTLLAPAEFGRNLGAQVNALSKSGGNDFHGSLFAFYNNQSLNARNTFDTVTGNTTTDLKASGLTGSPVFVDGAQKRVTNFAGNKDKFQLLDGGLAIGGRLVRNKLFFFVSAEGHSINGTQERNFAVPTVAERGVFNSGATGLQECHGLGGVVGGVCRDGGGNPVNFSHGYPTSIDGDAVFSLFPFANNPTGIYGANTYTQALSTDARGRILSGKIDWNIFKIKENQQVLTARYNNTDDKRDLTDVGGALFSAVRPVVRTDNFSSYLSGGITDNMSNELRFSWGRTRLRFDELRDTTGFILPVSSSIITNPDERRFMLNARRVVNFTLPVGCSPTGCFAPSQATHTTIGTTENTKLGPIGQLNMAGFSPVGVDVFNFPQQRTNDTYQVADTLRWQIGSHNFSFGTDIRRVYLASDLPRNSRPLVTFNAGIRFNTFTPDLNNISLISPQSLAAAGAAGGFFQSIAASGKNAKIDLGYNQYDLFVQDDWRISRKLNLNLGLRYEYNATPKEANNKIESTFGQQFTSTGYTRLSGLSSFINGRTSIYDADKNNFAPRIGFAYGPTPDLVIRAGYGMYYDQIIGSVVSQSRNVFPTFTTANFGGGVLADNNLAFTLFNPLFAIFDPALGFVCNPSDLFTPCGASSIRLLQPGSLNTFNSAITPTQFQSVLNDIYLNFPYINGTTYGATLPARKMDTPLSHQFSVGLEHKVRMWGRESVISAAYVYTAGRSLLRYSTPNLGANLISAIFHRGDGITLLGGSPTVFGYTIDPFVAISTLERPNRNIGPINRFETTGRSRYDALQIGIRGQLSRSIHYQANYAYGDVRDDTSDVFDLAGSFALPQNSLTFAGEYAPANFDVRHRFTYNFMYGLPDLKDHGGAVQYLFGSWQIAGTGKFNTGQPFTVNTVFDVNHDGNLTDRLNNTQFIVVTGAHGQPIHLSANAVLSQMRAPFGSDGAIPRNSFRANSVIDLDMSVSKRFRIVENQNLQFRVDFFNFINRANYGVPVRFLEMPGFGRANDTLTPGRRIQFGLKYNF